MLFDFPEEEEDRLSNFENCTEDLIVTAIEIGDNIAPMAAAGPLALHALSCPLSDSEALSGDNDLFLKKFAAEALHKKETVILGWLIDEWASLVKLLQDKCIAWSRSVHDALDAKIVSCAALDKL